MKPVYVPLLTGYQFAPFVIPPGKERSPAQMTSPVFIRG